MQDSSLEAGRARGVAPKRQAAKVPVGAKRPGAKKLRVQLHLGESLVQRLGVHCAMVGKNQSAMAEEILGAYLTRFGKGREIFGQADGELLGRDSDPSPE